MKSSEMTKFILKLLVHQSTWAHVESKRATGPALVDLSPIMSQTEGVHLEPIRDEQRNAN